MATPDIAICVTTYQKPWHLRRVLASIAGQLGVDGKFEVAVTDDGSSDETPEIVEEFRRRVDFPVRFTTHEHTVFHPARCRNDGARATSAPYLLFVDGDCVMPPDHMAIHLARRRPGYVMLGFCFRVDKELSAGLTEEGARDGEFLAWDVGRERRLVARRHRKARLYCLLRHPSKPRLASGNFGIWRTDFERVNGFDENFRGWGQEDDDLGRRLRRAGIRFNSILGWTQTYHLWHPPDPSAPKDWRKGPNVPYFSRRAWLTRCRNGLVPRSSNDLAIQTVSRPSTPDRATQMLGEAGQPIPVNSFPSPAVGPPEVEILFTPGEGRFSKTAAFQVLVALDDTPPSTRLLRQADLIVSDRKFDVLNGTPQFPLSEFRQALDWIA
jgi:glycosyltransferase involved in cell wall biosynthesis